MKWNQNGTYYPEYFIKDHLGNVRVVHSPSSGLSQANDYYPFGLEIPVYGVNDNQIKYNSKELQTDAKLNWYDYGARFHDPVIGRWHAVDPLANKPKNFSVSPYAYTANNPINRIDPDGRDWFYYQSHKEKKKSWHWQEGDVAKYTNTIGKEVTSKRGFDYLVTYKITGKNSEGAVTGSLQLWGDRNPNKGALVTANGVFSGNSNYQGMSPIPEGNYMMKIGTRDADGPQKLKPDGSNPIPYEGMQAIPNNAKFEWQGQSLPMNPTITNAYGNGRIRLNQTDADLNPVPLANQPAGYYLHGKKDPHNWTHGCVADKSEVIFNYLWNSTINENVPLSVEY